MKGQQIEIMKDNPYILFAKEKESLIQTAKRAWKYAQATNKTITFIRDGISCLAFPEDNLNKIIHGWELMHLKAELARIKNN